MRYRGLVPPLATLLVLTGVVAVQKHRSAARQHQRQAMEEALRLEAAQAVPSQEVLQQVRDAAKAFMAERHPGLDQEGWTFTPLTRNVFLVGVAVFDPLQGNRYVARLTAERLRDGDWGEEGEPADDPRLIWLVDYATPDRLREMADRHGFAPEVDRVRTLARGRRMSWGQADWLDDYQLWACACQGPPAYAAGAGGGFTTLPAGYRFQDPDHPVAPAEAAWMRAALESDGDRPRAYSARWPWRPPSAGRVFGWTGSAYGIGSRGALSGRVSMGVARGGFGAAGHAAGAGAHAAAAGS